VTLLISIVYFLRLNHDSVYMVFPKYNWNTVLNVTNALDSVRRLGAARGSSAAGTSVPQDQGASGNTIGNDVASEERYYGYDVAEMSKTFKLGMNLALGLTAALLACGHTWINCCRGSSDADGGADSHPLESPAVEFLAEQSILLKEQNELMLQLLQRQLPVAPSQFMKASCGEVSTKSGFICASCPVGGAAWDIEAQRTNSGCAGVPVATAPSSVRPASSLVATLSQVSESTL